jgi:hypothetical protein
MEGVSGELIGILSFFATTDSGRNDEKNHLLSFP